MVTGDCHKKLSKFCERTGEDARCDEITDRADTMRVDPFLFPCCPFGCAPKIH